MTGSQSEGADVVEPGEDFASDDFESDDFESESDDFELEGDESEDPAAEVLAEPERPWSVL